ncbi:phage tail tip lysozyme [Selenomonas sputigena]|uniref:Phage tail lysozyme domain-containing protein n=1 Tax=Selenomonas sputigena (strain ATCC 35185 / DSM 20758 / CCUG 44933 / VPI D19B-28) TaxID=546271 RepID=C9LU94_SELS3|nr:phage tail tip lysozyme [Selenomonas sputigena]AEC00281.1 hypothetical protein Selsp_1322 [Selenomonas sputigena ATCC 35185]EEX77625.1 hypothetical protein SELSPUOL_00901 [Selenomonas sputigena ATCC 35185]
MIGEMIQEYLVGLGAKVDRPGFQQAEATIKNLDRTVETATGHMATNFVKASGIISAAIVSVSTAAAGLMKSAAEQDLAMQKLSRQMMVSKDAAWTLKKATDALGESIQDIMLTLELMARFEKLTADGKKMKVGGDFAETMKNFRDLMFEFTRLKQEVSYAMTWVGYYLMKYLNRPLTEAREKFRSFNDAFIKNMSVWTEKAARGLVYIINIGKHFLELIWDVGKALGRMWDGFPRGVKIATAAIAALALVMKATPLTRMIMLVGSLLLLIDDYYGHMEGKQSAFGEYWDKLNEYIEVAKGKWEEFKAFATPFWEQFVEFCSTAKDKIFDFARGLGDFLDRVRDSGELQEFLAIMQDLGSAIWELATTYIKTWLENVQLLYASMEKHGGLDSMRNRLQKLWEAFKAIIRTISSLIHWFARLLDEIRRTEEYRELIDAVGELWSAMEGLLDVIYDLVGIAFRGLFGEMSKANRVYSFRDAVRAVMKVFSLVVQHVARTIRQLKDLFKVIRDNKWFRKFWEEMGKAIDKAIEKTGAYGRALLALSKGDFKGALKIVGEELMDAKLPGKGKGPTRGDKDGSREERAGYIMQKLMNMGYSQIQAAGLVGNFLQEKSDLDYSYDDGARRGIGQWMGERYHRLAKFAEENGYASWDDLDAQIAFTDWELHNTHTDALDALRAANTTGEAAKAIFDLYEIPLDEFLPNRQDYAADAYGWLESIPLRAGGGAEDSKEVNPEYYQKWDSQNGMVSWDNDTYTDVHDFRQETIDFLNEFGAVANQYGVKPIITGGSEKKGHRYNGWDSHANGYKVDISPEDITGKVYEALVELVKKHNGILMDEGDHFDITIYGPGNERGTGGWGDASSDGYDDGFMETAARTGGYTQKIYNVLADLAQKRDPVLYNGLVAGGYQSDYARYARGGSSNVVYQVNVGGVTVNGTDKSAKDIGREVGDATMRQLEQRGEHILRSRTMAGAPVLV